MNSNNVKNSYEKYLVFKLKNENYAIKILDVKEIIAMTKITEVPNSPSYVKGIINLRGTIVPAIDLRSKFNFSEKEYDRQTNIVIGLIGKEAIGLIIDQSTGVSNIKKEDLSTPPKFGAQINSSFIEAVAKKRRRSNNDIRY